MAWSLSFRNIFWLLCSVQFIALVFILKTGTGSQQKRFLNYQAVDTSYKFDDPETAYYILKKLDIYEPVDLGYTEKQALKEYNTPVSGLKPDFEYCDKHRAYFVENPEFIFKEKNFITGYRFNSVLRKHVIPAIGNDIMRKVGFHTPKAIKKQPTYDARLDANIFFFFEPTFFHRQINKQFSCMTQVSNHIPGHQSLYMKDRVGQSLVEYTKKYESKPHCFNAQKHFPRTWVLNNEEQCRKFFDEFNSERYQELKEERTIVYFRKVGHGIHEGRGVYPVNEQEETRLRTKFQNGALCGKVRTSHMIQTAIHNPLLFNGHKADFRIPMLIASTNPMIVYYHDGFLRVSLEKFSLDSDERGSFVTNIAVSRRVFNIARKNGTYEGRNESELRADAVWTFKTAHEYLMSIGKVTDPNWLDNYLRPEIKKLIVHVIRMTQGPFLKQSSLFEFYGLDIMLDDDLNLWFIEANSKPGMEGFSNEIKGLFKEFLTDSFEVVFGLLRSRTKRMINYVNNLVKEGKAWRLNGEDVHIEDLETRIQEFKEITKNYFEPEFVPGAQNSLTKVVDENYSGTKRYGDYLERDCL